MKRIKNCILILLTTLTLIACVGLCACGNSEISENSRSDKTIVNEWKYDFYLTTSAPTRLGIPVSYEFENATIESNLSSDKSVLIFGKSANIDNTNSFPDYAYYSNQKQATKKECPFEFKGSQMFQWASAGNWRDYENRGTDTFSDYITFIAKIDDNIVGYAVVYVWTDGKIGNGEVLADMEFPKINEKFQKVSKDTVNDKVKEVIEKHKNSNS